MRNPYSLSDRAEEDVLALCRQHGIAHAPYFPLGSALPSLPKVVDHPVVQDVAGQVGPTAPDCATTEATTTQLD